MQSTNFELDILIHGSKARTYKQDGRVYIEGREGTEFSVLLKNNTPQRVLAVLTVDGLSVIDGKEGSFKSGGYILDPWESTKVPGWRLNNKEVANFEFASPNKSYAAKKGRGGNLGIIGCAFFYEKKDYVQELLDKINELEKRTPKIIEEHHYHYPKDWWWGQGTWYTTTTPGFSTFTLTSGTTLGTSNSVSAFNSCDAPMGNSKASSYQIKSEDVDLLKIEQTSLGTKFGDKAIHKVSEESFNRVSEIPTEVLTVYYDTKDGLKRRGIDTDPTPSFTPSAFPKESKFCEPPMDW
jgi:hypothetical protein